MTRKDPRPATPAVRPDTKREPVSLDVTNEYGGLRTVLVHRPGAEMERLTQGNGAAFLFEEIPRPDRLQREHDAFVETLEGEGVRVLHLERLLRDVLQDEPTRRRLLRTLCEINLQRTLANVLIDAFGDDPRRVQSLLMTGLTARELATETNVQLQTTSRGRDFFLVRPLPHSYCTRDPGAVVGRRVVCANMHFDVRIPEPLLLRTILTSHPIFRGAKLGFGADRSSQRPFTIEGGDVIVLSDEAVAVGCSERTRSASIHLLAERLFESDGVARVYEVHVPARRSHVHLDTVLSVIDRGRIVASSTALDRVTDVVLYEPYRIANHTAAVPVTSSRSFREILADEIGNGSLEVCDINDGVRGSAGEPPPDATGVLAIGPSRVIAYDRNVHANQVLRERGVDVIEIEGVELGKSHGGPRCIALPLRRSAEA